MKIFDSLLDIYFTHVSSYLIRKLAYKIAQIKVKPIRMNGQAMYPLKFIEILKSKND